MLSIEEFSDIIIRRVDRLVESQELAIGECFGRICAEQVVAPTDMPPKACSAMDGYAMSAADWQPRVFYQISQKIFAGYLPEEHSSATLARIFTGGTLPDGADCVVIQENSQVDDGKVQILKKPLSGDNVRPAASNFSRGQVLIEPGVLINAQRLALAAMAGKPHMQVRRRIRVVLCTIGDELQSLGRPLQPGKIYNSNRLMIEALLVAFGCQVKHRHLPDNQQAIAECFIESAKEQDIIISSGGASVGEADYAGKVLADIGEVHAWKVALKPGKPTLFGTIGTAYYFGLPGNPSSSMITLCIFVRLAICRLLGLHQSLSDSFSGYTIRISEGEKNTYSNKGDRDHLIFCRKHGDVLLLNHNQSSASLESACWATGICRVASATNVKGGDLVEYIPFTDLFSLPLS